MSLPSVPRRLRALHPLIDGDGSCSLVYDLERAAVVEVPDDLQFYVAPALETGDLDEDLLGWLVSEDLYTAESWADWESETSGQPRLKDEIHCWLEPVGEDAAVTALDLLFKRGFGRSGVAIHLDWPGALAGPGLVERLVVEATRRAASSHQEISFELALDPSQVTPAVACSLACYPLHLRLRCGRAALSGQAAADESQPWQAAEAAVRLLLERMADTLTVQCDLAGPARVLELWNWARQVGIRHLDAIRFDEQAVPGRTLPPRGSRAREFRNDLAAICEETCADLEAGRQPIEFEPLWRIVRRLARREAPMAWAGRAVTVLAPHAGRACGTYPFSCFAADAAVDDREEAACPCHACWARLLCSHSAYVVSPLAGEDLRAPSEERCACWLAEAEVALRLCHRLAQIDAIQVSRLVDLPARLSTAPLFGGAGQLPQKPS